MRHLRGKTVPSECDKLIAINRTGALHMHHAVRPGMAERKSGRIVNIASDITGQVISVSGGLTMVG